MKRPLILLALIPLGFWGIFALPEVLAANPTFWEWRKALIILTGTLALWWMSAGIALAARPAWLEKHLGGLDKLYRLHKYIGIGSGILVFSHWMMEWLPKKMAKLGWVPSRPRGPKGMQDMWLSLAKDVGEWAGYILLALVVIALVRRIPYRYFRLVHKAFAPIFLACVFHGLPGDLGQEPLLGIEHGGLARRDAEERRVEGVGVVDDALGPLARAWRFQWWCRSERGRRHRACRIGK